MAGLPRTAKRCGKVLGPGRSPRAAATARSAQTGGFAWNHAKTS